MSLPSRLHRIIAAKPSINAAKPATNATNPAIDAVLHPANYETPDGLRSVVDNFKKLCEGKQFRRNTNIYSTTVRRLAQAQAFPMIHEILEHQKQYEEISREGFVIRLITLYGKAGMFDHALALFDQMPHRTNMSLNALLAASNAAKRYDTVPELFHKLHSQHSIKPCTSSYNILMNALFKLGSTDSALSKLCEMEELGLEPDVVTFNTLLRGFYEQNRYAEGEKIWSLMLARSNVSPDMVSYMLRMRAIISDGGGVNEAVKAVDEMRANGVEPDARIFNLLVEGFCGDGNVEEAKYWYHELVRRGCDVHRGTYRALVPFLCEKGDFDLAFEFCKDAIDGKTLLVDEGVLKLVADGLVAEDRVGEAEELVGLALLLGRRIWK